MNWICCHENLEKGVPISASTQEHEIRKAENGVQQTHTLPSIDLFSKTLTIDF